MANEPHPYTVRGAVDQIEACAFECQAGPLANNTAWAWMKAALEKGPQFWPGQGVFYLVQAVSQGGVVLQEWRHFYIVGIHMDSDAERRLWLYDLSNDPPAPYHYGTVQVARAKEADLRISRPESNNG